MLFAHCRAVGRQVILNMLPTLARDAGGVGAVELWLTPHTNTGDLHLAVRWEDTQYLEDRLSPSTHIFKPQVVFFNTGVSLVLRLSYRVEASTTRFE